MSVHVRPVRACAIAAVAAVVLVGCGAGVTEDEGLPVVVAETIDVADLGRELRTPAPSPTPVPSATPPPAQAPDGPAAAEDDDLSDAIPAASDEPVGPTVSEAAAVVRRLAADLGAAEHVVVDLDGDGVVEVLVTGIVDQTGVLRVAWWDGEAFEALTEGRAGRGVVVTDLRVADVNDDGDLEVLVEVEGEGRRSLAIWRVRGRGDVTPLEAVGGCHDGSHVFGVTGVRLEARAGGSPAIVATCDDSPLPVADWSEQRWVWQDGAYRVEVPAPTPSPSPSPSPEPTQDTEDGRGDGLGKDKKDKDDGDGKGEPEDGEDR